MGKMGLSSANIVTVTSANALSACCFYVICIFNVHGKLESDFKTVWVNVWRHPHRRRKQCTEPLVFHLSAHIIRLKRQRCLSEWHLLYSLVCLKWFEARRDACQEKYSHHQVMTLPNVRRQWCRALGVGPGRNTKAFRESPGRTGE